MGKSFKVGPGPHWYLVIDGSQVLHIAEPEREWVHTACGRWYNRCRVLICNDLEKFDVYRTDFRDLYKEIGRRDPKNSAAFLVNEEVKSMLVKDLGFRLCKVCETH